jgi:hypothetical protein
VRSAGSSGDDINLEKHQSSIKAELLMKDGRIIPAGPLEKKKECLPAKQAILFSGDEEVYPD